MTNPTPHGQVPEALRLAHIFDNPLPPEWPDMVAAAAELRRQHARIAELEAEIAGGVQALSAAPAGWRELAARVMDALADAQDKTNSEYPEHVKCYPSWASHARWLRWHADMFRTGKPVGNGAGQPGVLAALAASPTPPAEQQAQPSDAENLRRALRFYADGEHFIKSDGDAWDTVSGEPQNYWCDEAGTATVEDGSIAKLALEGHAVRFEDDDTPQPKAAPQHEAQEPVAWLNPWRADQVTTDYDAYGERGIPLYTAPQPSPTAQTDSVPAIQGETNVQLDTDSNSPTPGQQRDVAGPVAVGQPVGHGSDSTAGDPSAQRNKLLTVAERNIRSFLRSAVFKSESDREAALNCVDVLWEAVRAPADSVAAPAEKQAAPKAAPGGQNTVPAEWLEQAYREGWAACRDAETIGEEAEDWAFGNSTANSRMIDAQQAAPQQEAQEPVAWYEYNADLDAWFLAYRRNPKAKTRPLVFGDTTPQPAPAPLSEREDIAMIDAAMVEMANIVPPLKRSECARLIRAALAAQGGKV